MGDVSGVVLQVALTMGTGAALGFRCSHTARRAYTALITGIATSMAILFKLPGLSDSARATSITGCGLLGLIPVFHYFCLGVGSAAGAAPPFTSQGFRRAAGLGVSTTSGRATTSGTSA